MKEDRIGRSAYSPAKPICSAVKCERSLMSFSASDSVGKWEKEWSSMLECLNVCGALKSDRVELFGVRVELFGAIVRNNSTRIPIRI